MLMDLKLLGHQVCMSTHYDSVYWTVKDIWNECLDWYFFYFSIYFFHLQTFVRHFCAPISAHVPRK